MKGRCKHASLTIERLFSAWSVQSGSKEDFSCSRVESSFETPACQHVSLGAEELNGVESSELAVAKQYGKKGIRL
jgi:hypothetical protein